MEAILKSGKKIHGKLAQILVKKGRATPTELEEKPKVKPKAKRKPKAKK